MRSLLLAALFVSTSAYAGYDLHITRKMFWADESGPRISLDEWLRYAETDHQIAQDSQNGEEDFLVSLPKETFPIWYRRDLGEIYTKNPSKDANHHNRFR